MKAHTFALLTLALLPAATLSACGSDDSTSDTDASSPLPDGSPLDAARDARSDAPAPSLDATVPTDSTVGDADGNADAADATIDAAVSDVGSDADAADAAANEAASPDASDAGDASASFDSGDAAGPVARIRLAHFATDDAALNFCVGPEGGPMTGPVFSPFMGFGDVSAYVTVPAGAKYVVRIVTPGGPCSVPNPYQQFGDLTTHALGAGEAVTVAATGDTHTSEPYQLRAYQDDVPSDVPSGALLVRVVDLSSTFPSVEFGAGAGATYVPLVSSLPLGAIPNGSNALGGVTIDAHGYVTTLPWGSPISARVAGAEIAESGAVASPNLDPSPLVSVFLIGRPNAALAPLQMITCFDAASGGAYCQNGGWPLQDNRLINLAPDSPAVDACFKLHSASSYTNSPIVLARGSTAGVSYRSQSLALPVVPRTGDYDAKFIAASPSATCADSPLAEVHIPPLYIGNRLALIQTAFGAQPAFAAIASGTGWQTWSNRSGVSSFNATTSGSIEIAALPDFDTGGIGGSTAPLAPGGEDTSPGDLVPGEYRFRVWDVGSLGTVLMTSQPVTLTPDTLSLLSWYPTSATGHALLLCPTSTSSDAGAPTGTCTPL